MLRLSTKSLYGTRLMVDLALCYGRGPIPLRQVAMRQEISGKYLGQIVSLLKVAGLIRAVRGAQGGYMLARAPEEISLADVVCAVEGPVALADCVMSPHLCTRVERCVVRYVWLDVVSKVREALMSVTLGDMVKRHNKYIASRR